MCKPETMMIGDVKYVREDAANNEVVNFTDDESVATRMIGKKVIVRSRNEGVNAGIVVIADETGVELTSCRRLWYHKPLNTEVSWYEGVAEYGLGEGSKVSCTVRRKVIIEDYSMTEVTDEAFETIMKETPNASN